MGRLRIGEMLCKAGKLSTRDVDEILEEQQASHHRFGDIALTWGICAPQHVWHAWCDQLAETGQCVDLEAVGVDAQAAQLMPMRTAADLGLMPFRICEDELIVAAVRPITEELAAQLARQLNMKIRFVPGSPQQIENAQHRYYGAPVAA